MKFVCSSCGAEIDDTMLKCPYCDTMIAAGAEAEYMEKLYDIQEDMEELQEIPLDVVKEEVRHQGRRIGKIMLIVAVIIVAFIALIFWQERKYERDHTADYIWEQENFPVMSELYENQEYEELLEIMENAYEENRSVWNWEYYDEFCEWMEEE